VREDSGEEDYYVKPVVHEITVGEKIEFSLVKIKHGRYTTVSNDKIVWVVANEKSISEFIGKITIGTINSNGVFIAKNIGTCFVRAIIDEKIKSEFKIAVKCSENVDGDLNKIVSLYKSRIPEGPFHKDLRDGKISPPFKYMNPGYATNLLARKDPIYEEFVCGGCQGDALKFLHNIQANSSECTLLNGYEFGPIEGSYGGHHAVVIYPKGTDWKKTGLVLDSWYHQKPEQFSIDVWKEVFHPIAGDTSSSYRLEYPTTKDPHDYDYAFWTVAEAFVKDIRGVFFCPVNILITDNEGRRLGVLDDGSMAFEIPNASIMNLPNDAGNNNWYFELDSDVSSNYNLEIIGTDEGTFELLIANKKDKSIKYYGKQPITQGEKAEIVLDSSNPEAPLILQDGTEVQPTSIEKSKRDNYNHILAQSAVQKVLIGQNLQFEGFNRTPVTVSRIVSGDIENIYQADANNSIHNLNWQTSGAFYVNYVTGTPATYDAQLSVEEPDMPLELKVGTKEVSAIAAGTNLIIDTRGMNLFPEDQVDLVVIGPDGQIKHDDVNDQQFTNITVDYLTSNYGDSDNTLETAGWGIGAYIFWVKTDSEYACGLDAESDVKPLKILRGSITIKAETASTVERETVKLTVMGVAGDPIRVESSPLSDNVLFKESIDDTPTGANYHVNWFNDAIDEDGIRRYAVEFSNTGIYTIKVTVASGDREGDSDTVEIKVSEKEVAFDLPYTVVIGDKIHIKGTATSGTYVSVYVEDTLYRKLVNIVIEDGEFRQEVKTTDIGMDVPGIVNLKAWIDCDKYAGEERPTRSPDGEDAILLTTPTLMTAELSVPAVALEDDFSVIGTAKGQTEVTILSVPPRGGGGKSLLDKGQKGVSPRKASVSMTDGTFAKKMTVQEDADSGVYYIIVLSSGMDGVWGMTGQEHLEAALDEKYHIPSLTYGIICTKTQEQVIAILDDLTQTPGSDDLMQKLTLKVGDIDSLTLNPIADVVVGDPLVVTGETSRKDGSIIWLTVKKLYYEIVPQAAIATDKTFSATFDRTGAPPGTYTVRAYDEYGYTVATKVNIIAETPAS
jgi:hypothetical protein